MRLVIRNPAFSLPVLLGCLATLAGGFLVAAPAANADTSNTCPTARWEGATLAGADRAYRVGVPGPDNRDTKSCYIASRSLAATKGEPVYLVAGYKVANKPGTAFRKSLIFVQILCFGPDGRPAFRNSAQTNIYNSLKSATGFYPRALFYPPASGTYDCGVRVVNWNMGQEPLPVYALSGYLSFRRDFAVAKQDGSARAGYVEPLRTGEITKFMSKGSRTTLRQVVLTVPEGVRRVRASTTVNYSKCSWNRGGCPPGSHDGPLNESRHWLRIVAWQTRRGSDDSSYRCHVLAGAEAPVPPTDVPGARHHRTLKRDADLTLGTDPDCARKVVIRTVIEMNNDPDYDAGWAHGQSTVLSAFARS